MTKILEDLLRVEIDNLDKESTNHKRLFRRVQVLVILFTSASAIVSGLALFSPLWVDTKMLQFTVLILTTLTTAATAYGELRRSRELWQHEREVYYALKDLRREFLFLEGLGELNAAKQHDIFERAQAVLGSSAHKWASIQARLNAKPEPHAEDSKPASPAGV